MENYIQQKYQWLPLITGKEVDQYSLFTWKFFGKTSEDIFPAVSAEDMAWIARKEGYRYIVLTPNDDRYELSLNKVQSVVAGNVSYRSDAVIVYDIAPVEYLSSSLLFPNMYWSEPRRTKKSKKLYRWMREGAELQFVGPDATATSITFRFNTGIDQTIRVLDSEEVLHEGVYEKGTHTITVPLRNSTEQIYFDLTGKVKVFEIIVE